MKSIDEQLKRLREYAKLCDTVNDHMTAKLLRDAANTITLLTTGALKHTRWIFCSEKMPPEYDQDLYLVTIKERWKESEPWEYHVDVAENNLFGKGYIDDFWDTMNDWKEGQEVHVIAWMPLPEPCKASPTGEEVSRNEDDN